MVKFMKIIQFSTVLCILSTTNAIIISKRDREWLIKEICVKPDFFPSTFYNKTSPSLENEPLQVTFSRKILAYHK